jgi:hypothetical protein
VTFPFPLRKVTTAVPGKPPEMPHGLEIRPMGSNNPLASASTQALR